MDETVKQVSKKEDFNPLCNETIIVKPILENLTGILSKDKDKYVLLDGFTREFPVPIMQNGGLKQVLTVQEQDFFEGYFDASKPKGWMGTYVEDSKNVWLTNAYKVLLTEKPFRLHLGNPIDFIKYKVLLANSDEIAPTFENRNDKAYTFYCQKAEEVDKNNADNIELEFKAMEEILKMGNSVEKMRSALLVIYKGDTTKVSQEVSVHTCKTMLRDWAMKNTRMFLELLGSEDYKYQVMLYRGLEKGALVRRGMEYRLGYADGELVGGSMVEALQYLKRLHTDPSSQEKYSIYLKRIG